MKKSDLENGMIVEYRNGDKYIVIKDYTDKSPITQIKCDILLGINIDGYDLLDYYNEDLEMEKYKSLRNERDIVRVWGLKSFRPNNDNLILLWEREKDKIDIVNDIVDDLCEKYKIKAREVYQELYCFCKIVIRLTLENGYLITIDLDKKLFEDIEEKEIKLRINNMFVKEFCRLALKEVEK